MVKTILSNPGSDDQHLEDSLRKIIREEVPSMVREVVREEVPPMVREIVREEVPPMVRKIVREEVPPIVEKVVTVRTADIRADIATIKHVQGVHSIQLSHLQSGQNQLKNSFRTHGKTLREVQKISQKNQEDLHRQAVLFEAFRGDFYAVKEVE